MAGHPDLPKNVPALLLRKSDIFDSLKKIDNAEKARDRILAMENDFREKIGPHIGGLQIVRRSLPNFTQTPLCLCTIPSKKAIRVWPRSSKTLCLLRCFRPWRRQQETWLSKSCSPSMVGRLSIVLCNLMNPFWTAARLINQTENSWASH